MGSAKTTLTAADQSRLAIVAIGRSNQAYANSNFCNDGVMSKDDDATWTEISGFKRSITFYKREAGAWCYYCQFSMTTDQSSFLPTVRTLLDTSVCGGSAAEAAAYPSTMPAGDALFEATYLADPDADLIRATHSSCANMRDEPSMSTACMALDPHGGGGASYFAVSVCCTSDYCAMRSGAVAFSYLAHSDGRHYLLREGLAVQVLAEPSSSAASCEAAAQVATDLYVRYFPLLGQAALETACSAAPPSPPAAAGTAAAALPLPAPGDATFSNAAVGLASHAALVASSHAFCANMRTTRSIATACLLLPHADAASSYPAAWVGLSVCCSSDLCEMRDAVAAGERRFAYAAAADALGSAYFLLKDGQTVQAIDAPAISAAACEAAVTAQNSTYYPLLSTTRVDDICTTSSPPPPPPTASAAAAAGGAAPSPPPPPHQLAAAALDPAAAAGIAVGAVAGVAVVAAAVYALRRGCRRAPVVAKPSSRTAG